MLFIISRSDILRIRNFSDESCGENQNKHFVFNNFFFENGAVYEIMGKKLFYSRTGHRLHYGECALHAL